MRVLMLLFVLISTQSVLAQTLTFGIVPQQSAKTLVTKWGPLIDYLGSHADIDIQFATAKNIPEFEQRLAEGVYDIAYMNPYHYTVFSQSPGYRALAKEKDKLIKGIIVTRKDSKIHSLKDLDGLSLAFPSPAAFAASILPRAKLAQEGIKISPKYVSSHDSVYLNVERGFYPAGGGIERTLSATTPAISSQLKVLWTTDGYTPHAIAVHPRVSQDLVRLLRAALLSVNDDDEGKKALTPLQFKGLVEADDKDWDDVRALNIQLLDDL